MAATAPRRGCHFFSSAAAALDGPLPCLFARTMFFLLRRSCPTVCFFSCPEGSKQLNTNGRSNEAKTLWSAKGLRQAESQEASGRGGGYGGGDCVCGAIDSNAAVNRRERQYCGIVWPSVLIFVSVWGLDTFQ